MRIKAQEEDEAIFDKICLSTWAVQCTAVYSADLYSWQVSFVSFVLTRPSPREDRGGDNRGWFKVKGRARRGGIASAIERRMIFITKVTCMPKFRQVCPNTRFYSLPSTSAPRTGPPSQLAPSQLVPPSTGPPSQLAPPVNWSPKSTGVPQSTCPPKSTGPTPV